MKRMLKIVAIIGLVFGLSLEANRRLEPVSQSNIQLSSIVNSKSESAKYRYIAPFIQSMRTITGRRYCSASSIYHRGKIYTVTNRHCCEASDKTAPLPGFRIVGTSIQRVIHVDQGADVCILTSTATKGLSVAKEDPRAFDPLFVMGHPKGYPLTVREGFMQYTEKVCINYGGYVEQDIRCVESYVSSVVTRPGNSGSPTFNYEGEVVGVLYAGNDIDSISVTRKQLLKALDIARAVYGKNK